jgi:glycogen debranching enzyme
MSRTEPPAATTRSAGTEAHRTNLDQPLSMEEVVGYGSIDCAQETPAGPTLILKQDRLFLLIDAEGQITPPGRCGHGLFFDDTRILSHYCLQFAGGAPSLLSAQVLRMYQAQIDLAISNQAFGGNSWDPKNVVHILRELLLDDSLVERVTLTNYLTQPIDYSMELAVGCDFADIFEVRGWRREGRGQFFAPRVDDRSITFSYRGRDGALIRTEIRFTEPPTEISEHGACWRFRLGASTRREIEWEVLTEMPGSDRSLRSRGPLEERSARLERSYDDWNATCSGWQTDVAAFNTMLGRATGDLRALHLKLDGSEIIAAGIPWYSTVFGRDSIITGLQILPLNPTVAVETLRYLAQHQGRRENPITEEQPGKIMHELRRGEMARSGEIPHVPYFGTVDATPLWLILLHETWRWTGDDALVRELLPYAVRALEWINRYGDLDGDGLVEYARSSPKGLVNQGWKDSGDGVPFPDGRLPRPPLALVEVQGYVYDAKVRMAALYEAIGQQHQAEELRREAEQVRAAIVRSFWLEELGTFALALDGDKQPLPTVTSNAGHLLWSRVPSPEQASRLADRLLGAGMFSGWGIRTLSAAHPVFNPMSYHNGSVWPHDNALVALGLGLYGYREHASRILTALYEAGVYMESSRLPELFCGMERLIGMQPVRYPVSCVPQAWAAGAFFMLLQGTLGLFPEAPAGVLHVRAPVLPGFLRDLTVTGLPIGKSRVALQFRRHRDRTLVNLLEVEGAPLQVRIELS